MHEVSHPLVGFGQLAESITHLGEKGKGRNLVIQFLVVKHLTTYNLIIGCPTFNASKAIVIPSLALMKFEKDDGSLGSLYGD